MLALNPLEGSSSKVDPWYLLDKVKCFLTEKLAKPDRTGGKTYQLSFPLKTEGEHFLPDHGQLYSTACSD